jgi:hypothetical protein
MATQGPSLFYVLRGEIGRASELLAIGKNLFINLVEKIARELTISNCWICRGALMSEEWPWKESSLNAYQLLLWNHSITFRESDHPQSWILTPEVIGKECLERTGPTYDKWVGETPCKWVLSYNETNLTWRPKNWVLAPNATNL